MASGLFHKDIETRVAIKTVKDPSEKSQRAALFCEIKILSNLDPHRNLVNMVGSCTSDFVSTGRIWMLLEFCDHGNIDTYQLSETPFPKPDERQKSN